MSIHYRVLHDADASAYRELRLRSFQESPLAFSESFEDEQHRSFVSFKEEIQTLGTPPEWFVLGAFDLRQLVGFVKFRRDQRSKARHKAMIHAMYLAPEYRKRSIGKVLMEKLLIQVRQLAGLEQVHLWVLHANNQSAANFYRSIGFRSQGPMVKDDLKWNDQYIDAEYMTLRL